MLFLIYHTALFFFFLGHCAKCYRHTPQEFVIKETLLIQGMKRVSHTTRQFGCSMQLFRSFNTAGTFPLLPYSAYIHWDGLCLICRHVKGCLLLWRLSTNNSLLYTNSVPLPLKISLWTCQNVLADITPSPVILIVSHPPLGKSPDVPWAKQRAKWEDWQRAGALRMHSKCQVIKKREMIDFRVKLKIKRNKIPLADSSFSCTRERAVTHYSQAPHVLPTRAIVPPLKEEIAM